MKFLLLSTARGSESVLPNRDREGVGDFLESQITNGELETSLPLISAS